MLFPPFVRTRSASTLPPRWFPQEPSGELTKFEHGIGTNGYQELSVRPSEILFVPSRRRWGRPFGEFFAAGKHSTGGVCPKLERNAAVVNLGIELAADRKTCDCAFRDQGLNRGFFREGAVRVSRPQGHIPNVG